MTNEQLVARNTELESNNQILLNDLNNKKMELKIVLDENKKLKQDKEDMQEHMEFKRCESCEKLVPETIMSYVGNELICEMCRVNGYGR